LNKKNKKTIMGYAIKPIAELNTIDYTNLKGTAETVRKSIDGTQFIVEGDEILDYTQEQMLEIVQGAEWTQPMENK
jgi:hypothetical protein